MPGNKYESNSTHIPGRVERLLRDREIRKNSKAFQSNEATDNTNSNDIYLREDDISRVEQYLEGAAAARANNEGYEKEDGKPVSVRQRLLVVANRLPVSAVRKGEDSWSLEISAGGLVSALLGKRCLNSNSVVYLFN